MKPGDSIIVVSGKLKGATGVIERESSQLENGFICRLTSVKPPEVKILGNSQIKAI